MRIQRRLDCWRPSNWQELTELLNNKNADGTPKTAEEYYGRASGALDVVLPYFYRVFDVKPLDDQGDGWTEEEIIELHNAYVQWTEKKSESTNGGPSSAPSTPEPTPSPAKSQPTKPSSGCGCGDK